MDGNNGSQRTTIKLNIIEHPQKSGGPRAGVVVAVIAVILAVIVGLVLLFGTATKQKTRPTTMQNAIMQNTAMNGYNDPDAPHSQKVPEHTEDPGFIEGEYNAVFTVSSSVEAGQIAVINAENISDPTRIEVNFYPELLYNGEAVRPVFYGEGGTYSALIPIPADSVSATEREKDFRVEINYGLTSHSLEFKVFERSYSVIAANATDEQIAHRLTDVNIAAFRSLLTNTANRTASKRLWVEDKFFSYYADGFKYSGQFWDVWRLSGGIEYRKESLDLKAKGNYNIVAVNSGIVVETGENEYLGKYVCVDHGMGLQTWYLHLSEVYVAEGDNVEAVTMAEYDKSYKVSGWDKAIGRCATKGTGFVENTNIAFSVMYTVNGVPVCPYSQNSGVGLEETGLDIAAYK